MKHRREGWTTMFPWSNTTDYFPARFRGRVPRFRFRKQPSRSAVASCFPSERIQTTRKCLVFPAGSQGTRWIAPDHFRQWLQCPCALPLRRSASLNIIPGLEPFVFLFLTATSSVSINTNRTNRVVHFLPFVLNNFAQIDHSSRFFVDQNSLVEQ